MKKFRWQLLILFLTGLVVGTLLIMEKRGGLGQAGTAQPVTGGVYTEALIGNLVRLNPLLDSNNQVDRDLDRLIFSGLVKFNSQGLPEPDLAQSIGVSQDGLIYNITLRDNITWHDGKPFTTDDIIFTIDLLRNGEGFIPLDLINFWKAVEVIRLDDKNLQFKLAEAFSPFQDYLAFGILPKHKLDGLTISQIADSGFNLQPIGTGPYSFSALSVEKERITGITLKAFNAYYNNPPFIEELNFRYYPDTVTAYQAFKDGFIQGLSEVPNDLLPQVMAESQLSLYSGRLPQMSMVLFNLNDPGVPFFQDAKIRKALLLAINRQKLIDSIFNGQAIIADSVIFPDSWAYLSSLQSVDYDTDQAALLLKEAGYVVTGDQNPIRQKGDQVFKFVFSYPDDELHKKVAESIQADWLKLNIDVILEPIPADELVSQKLDPRAFQSALVDLNFNRTPDPDPYPFWDLGQTPTGQNYSQWSNRLASDSIEQARVTTDLTERIRLYHNFQAIFQSELPALPLYYPVYSYAVDAQIQGVSMGPLIDTSDRFDSITSWFLVAKRAQSTDTPSGK